MHVEDRIGVLEQKIQAYTTMPHAHLAHSIVQSSVGKELARTAVEEMGHWRQKLAAGMTGRVKGYMVTMGTVRPACMS